MPRGVYVRSAELRAKVSRGLTRHGHSFVGKRTRTYNTWASMVQRCTNPNVPRWKHYGGRGITVCDRWLVFGNFLIDMGVRPEGKTIDRIDNDGNYEPGNCRWATQSEQARTSDPSAARAALARKRRA